MSFDGEPPGNLDNQFGDSLHRTLVPGYVFKHHLGHGATSQVICATQTALGRDVALKLIPTGGAQAARRLQRFQREIQILAGLDHPVLVKGVDAGEVPGFHWFAMELVEGFTLEELVAEVGPLSVRECLRIGMAVADALIHVHEFRVVHRDIKPSNIMLDGDGRVKLLDLGLAKSKADPSMTEDGTTLGTPQHMAPEQATGQRAVDARADIYSLCSTLYYALCGVHAHPGATTAEVLTHLLTQDPLPPSTYRELLPEALDLLLLRGLARDPNQRIESAQKLKNALQDIEAGQTALPQGVRRHRKLRRDAVLICSALTFVILLGAYSAFRARSNRESEHPPAKEQDPQVPLVLDAGDLRAVPLMEQIARTRTELLQAANSQTQASLSQTLASLTQQYEVEMSTAIQTSVQELVRAEVAPAGNLKESLAAARSFLPNLPPKIGHPPQTDPLYSRYEGYLEQARGVLVRAQYELWKNRFVSELNQVSIQVESDAFDPEQVKETLQSISSAALDLDTSGRELLEAEIRRVASSARIRSKQMHDQALSLARMDLQRKFFATARDRANRSSTRMTIYAPETDLLTQAFLAEVDLAEEALGKEAQAIYGIPLTREAHSLSAAERNRRVAALRDAVLELPPPAQAAALATEWDRLQAYVEIMERAASLRTRVLEVARGDRIDRAAPIKLRVLGDHLPRVRRLEGADETSLHFLDANDQTERIPVERVRATVLEEILLRGGMPEDADSLAVAAYWDGDHVLASAFLRRAGMPKTLSSLTTALELRLSEARASFDHEEERQAFDQLQSAHRSILDDRMPEAEQKLRDLRAELRSVKLKHGAFAKLHRSEIEDLEARIRSRRELQDKFATVAPRVRIDEEQERVQLEFSFKSGFELPKSMLLPERAIQTVDGLVLSQSDLRLLPLPQDLPRLTFELPDTAGFFGKASIRMKRAGIGRMGGVRLSFSGLQCLVTDALPDNLPFRAEPWHGLERLIYTWRPVEMLGVWRGEPASYRDHVRPYPKEFRFLDGDSMLAELLWTDKGVVELKWNGKSLLDVSASPWPMNTKLLEVTGWPSLLVEGVSMELSRQTPLR
jgi:serine/threonine protein kinase